MKDGWEEDRAAARSDDNSESELLGMLGEGSFLVEKLIPRVPLIF